MPEMTPGRIKKIREDIGDSKQEFANRMGLSVFTIVSWEKNPQTRSPQVGNVRELLRLESGGNTERSINMNPGEILTIKAGK